jgi:hypothetical protein
MAIPSLKLGDGKWAVKETKLLGTNPVLNKKLPVEIDVTNATIGTRVNKEGIIENGPKNLFTYSEDLSNSIWSKNNISVNQSIVLSPNKKLNVYKFIENTASGVHEISQQFSNFIIGSVYTVSFFAKAGEKTFVKLNSNGAGFGTQDFAIYDLSLGVVKGTGTSGTASIENVGDGWYRCTRTLQAISSGAYSMFICLSTGVITRTEPYQGDGQSGIYLWGIQLEQGSVATEYYPTTTRTNLARIDYSSGEGVLLLEPQRTNKLIYSNNVVNNSWVQGALYGTINYGISPEGIQNSNRILFTDVSQAVYQQYNGTLGEVNTFSCWIKGIYGQTIEIGQFTGFSLHTFNGEWQYFQSTKTTSVNLTVQFTSYSGATARDFEFYGTQVEVAPYATSYIPTLASAVTRNADLVSKTGIGNLINSQEGVLFVESAAFNDLGTGTRNISLSDGTNQNNILFYYHPSSTNRVVPRMFVNGVSVWVGETAISSSSNMNKFAIRWSASEVSFWMNGVKVNSLSITTATFPANTLNRFGFDEYRNTEASAFNARTKRVLIYKTALTDAELIELTTT